MTGSIEIESVEGEEREMRLRHHWMMALGYGLALARRTGLSPEKAAQLWMGPLLAGRPPRSYQAPDELEAWLRDNATAMKVLHGNVRLERDGETWTMKVSLAEDRQQLELWGASLEDMARWGAQQVRMLGALDGFESRGWLEGETMCLWFGYR